MVKEWLGDIYVNKNSVVTWGFSWHRWMIGYEWDKECKIYEIHIGPMFIEIERIYEEPDFKGFLVGGRYKKWLLDNGKSFSGFGGKHIYK